MYSPGRGNPCHCIVVLYVGEGSEREQCHLFGHSLSFSHFPSFPQTNWALLVLIPRWVDSSMSRTPWVSPINSPVRQGVSPATATSIGFYSQRFWVFSFLHWNPWFRGLFHSPVVPPCLSTRGCGTSHEVHQLALPHVLSPLFSVPPTRLDECFFNSLVVGLPRHLIFWQVWLIFVFKLVVVLLFVVRGSEAFLAIPPSWLEAWKDYFFPSLDYLDTFVKYQLTINVRILLLHSQSFLFDLYIFSFFSATLFWLLCNYIKFWYWKGRSSNIFFKMVLVIFSLSHFNINFRNCSSISEKKSANILIDITLNQQIRLRRIATLTMLKMNIEYFSTDLHLISFLLATSYSFQCTGPQLLLLNWIISIFSLFEFL